MRERRTYNADFLDRGSAGARDGSNIALVRVDTDERLAVIRLDILDNDVALPHCLAVAASAVQLAEVDYGEAVDGHGSQAVVLDHLVISASGTAVLHCTLVSSNSSVF